MIYLDNAATTRMSKFVFNAMKPYLLENYGNPNAKYSLGVDTHTAIERAREQVASMINAKPSEIVFTSSGSEANNMVLRYYYEKFSFLNQRLLCISDIEHDSIQHFKDHYSRGDNWSCLPVNEKGYIDIETVEKLMLNEFTPMFLCVMHTNNETGMKNDVEEIGEYCKERHIFYHVDAVQAAGSCKIDVKELQCDTLSLSAHKFHGPKGVGALYIRDGVSISPMIFGGSSQESGARGGTQNVPGIVGMGQACTIITQHLDQVISKEKYLLKLLIKTLRDYFNEMELSEIFHVNSDLDRCVKTASLRFDNVSAETLVLLLDNLGVCVSAGSACRSLESEPSRVLTAIGLTDEQARNTIRVSVSSNNTKEEMLEAARIIADSVGTLYSIHK